MKKAEVNVRLIFQQAHVPRGFIGGAKRVMSARRDVNAIASCVVRDAKQQLVQPVVTFFAVLSVSRMLRQF